MVFLMVVVPPLYLGSLHSLCASYPGILVSFTVHEWFHANQNLGSKSSPLLRM